MYSGVFADLGQRLSQRGYVVYAMDERGFGAWEKMQGPEARMNLDRILDDIKDSVVALHQKETGLPIFLLGEAMGGALVLKAAARYPDLIQGTISSAPGGDHFHSTHNYMTVCHRLFTGPNTRFSMGKELLASATPRPEVQLYMQNEAKVRLNLTPKELMACQFFMYKTRGFAHDIKTVPVMIVQGQKDGETKPESANRVFDSLSTSDKKMLPVETGDHYVYEDSHVNDQAMQATLSWLDDHLGKPATKAE
jgi:alpha-beta hydrolase superfamily lysophospholipase